MEGILTVILQSGNIVAIVAFVVCYLVIYFQRKSTAEKRNSKEAELQAQIELANKKAEDAKEQAAIKMQETQDDIKEQMNAYNTEKQLMQKDIEILKADNAGIKEDVKEIKQTLNNIAISIAELAAAAKVNLKNKDK